MIKDISLSISIVFLLALGVIILNSIAGVLFPGYLIIVLFSLVIFIFFSRHGFEITSVFWVHLYVLSIALLLITLLIGRITNETIRWIPIGSFTLQPSEIVRPFLFIFFAKYLMQEKLSMLRVFKAILLALVPTVLILVQPSLSVAFITVVGFFGVLLASNFNKKYLLILAGVALVAVPLFWQILAPYQKERISTFLNPGSDPLGAGYNSIQSLIAAGSGELSGRGLGRGIQTQLSFLPEKQTDFVFAALSEELGFVGAGLTLLAIFTILFRLIKYMEHSTSPVARAYLSGFFLSFLMQVFVHIGMNLGLMPVAGLPLPLVSAGGSSLLATMMGLGIAVSAWSKETR